MKTNRLRYLCLFFLMNTCIYARSIDSFRLSNSSIWGLDLPKKFTISEDYPIVGCTTSPSGRQHAENDLGRTFANGLPISVRLNPSNRKIDIDLLLPENQSYAIGVTDLLGQVLLKRDVVGKGAKQLETIDLEGKYSGTALVFLQNGLQQVSIMILIK